MFISLLAPAAAFAAPSAELVRAYGARADLRAAFDASNGYRAIPGSGAGYLIDLEDWATQYGWREDASLAAYAPTVAPINPAGAPPKTTAEAYAVIDRATGAVLAASRADEAWPVASLTKLMTAQIALDAGGDNLGRLFPVKAADDVGGAKLYVESGDTFTLDGLLFATLVGSANNAANAITRAAAPDRETFVEEMNRRAHELNLSRTSFADPTGIDPANVSTAREMARLADAAFRRRDIRRYTTTASAGVRVVNQGVTKTIKNTNWMLWKPEYDDIFVMAGKTGYLEESGWNLAVALRPVLSDELSEVLVVTFGSDSRADSFRDAEALARWAWKGERPGKIGSASL